nr:ribonuclease III [Roseimaritima sediminicola]
MERANLIDTDPEAPDLDYEAKIQLCQERIGYRFCDSSLLLEALTHASGASTRLASNERLEFLGDAILGMVVCEWLYQEHPESSEGELTKIKSAVVSRQTCGDVAREMRLDECLIVGKGVIRNRSYPRSLISDVFEAIVAAVYLDGGLDKVRPLIRSWLAEPVRESIEGQGSNYKSALQQLAQKELSSTPVYRLVTEAGPDHSKTFRVSAMIGEREFTPAWGRNKKEAEQRAAANALAELQDEPAPFGE